MAKLLKKCECGDEAKTEVGKTRKWDKCSHSWTVRYRTAGGRRGKQREQSFKANEKQKAKDFALKIDYDKRAYLESFVDPKAGEISFKDFTDKWLKHRRLKPASVRKYRSLLNRHIYPAFAGRPMSSLTKEEMREFYWNLPLAGSTVASVHTLLSGVFNKAVEERKLTESPVKGIDLPEVKTKKIHVPKLEQVEKLYQEMPGYLRVIIPLMAGCGLRVSEALAANVGNLVHEDTMYRVIEQTGRDENGVTTVVPLKHRNEGDFRDVPLPAWAAQAITDSVMDFGTNDDGYLVQPSRSGDYVYHVSISRPWKKAVKAAGLPQSFTPHGLRHFYATKLLASGVPLTDVSSWLGHNNVNVTYRTYRHYIPESGERARKVLDQTFGTVSSTPRDVMTKEAVLTSC
jgi:integrase